MYSVADKMRVLAMKTEASTEVTDPESKTAAPVEVMKIQRRILNDLPNQLERIFNDNLVDALRNIGFDSHQVMVFQSRFNRKLLDAAREVLDDELVHKFS